MIDQAIIDQYLKTIYDDYISWCDRADMSQENRDYFNEKFKNGLKAIKGKKYIKIIKEGSVHSFIVAESDPKFKLGDVLMAATYNAPARNKARGNVLEGTAKISWTGANYLI